MSSGINATYENFGGAEELRKLENIIISGKTGHLDPRISGLFEPLQSMLSGKTRHIKISGVPRSSGTTRKSTKTKDLKNSAVPGTSKSLPPLLWLSSSYDGDLNNYDGHDDRHSQLGHDGHHHDHNDDDQSGTADQSENGPDQAETN